MIYPEDIDNNHYSLYLTYEKRGIVCVHSDFSSKSKGTFWCSKTKIETGYWVPSIRDESDYSSHIKERRETLLKGHGLSHDHEDQHDQEHSKLDLLSMEKAGLFTDLPAGMAYDVEFVDPMGEIRYVCSTIVWQCREELHPQALTTKMAKLREIYHDTSKISLQQAATTPKPMLPDYEYQALKDLYYAFGGEFWPSVSYFYQLGEFITEWDFSANQSVHNPCVDQWQGIVCTCEHQSPNNSIPFWDDVPGFNYYYYDDSYHGGGSNSSVCHIVKLGIMQDIGAIDTQKLNASMPESIGNLTHLTHLHMQWAVKDDLPKTLFNLDKLEVLCLAHNYFHSLPDEIGNLVNLKLFGIFFSHLTGSTIPASISNMKSLRYMYFGYTGLQGTIPIGVWSLPELLLISLDLTYLTGTFPPEIGNNPNLVYINIRYEFTLVKHLSLTNCSVPFFYLKIAYLSKGSIISLDHFLRK